MKQFYILFLISAVATTTYSQSTIDLVKSLNANADEGIKTYFSDSTAAQAEEIAKLLNNSTQFFENTFNLSEEFEIAVLNQSDWKKITRIPFGLPFVSGPPYIVCFPAGTNNELGEIILSSLKQSNLPSKLNLTEQQIAQRFINLIGFHELGHIYAKALGIQFPNKWTFEFAATYLAYLYLESNSPESNKLWTDVGELLLVNINPKYTGLNNFEELYVKVGVENYAWYQVVFLKHVSELAKSEGISFIKELQEINLQSDNFSLDSLEDISNGFKEWAVKYKLVE